MADDPIFSDNDRVGEVIAKHYYDLFAYHAAQRLTTFNFFIVSLSFFCNAFALLVTKGSEGNDKFFYIASGLAMFSCALIVLFARLDRRNAQIIEINEKPLRRLQATFAERIGTAATQGDFETVKASDVQAYHGQTFSQLIPFIYVVAMALACLGMFASWFLIERWSLCSMLAVAGGVFAVGVLFIVAPMSTRRRPRP